MFDKNVSIEVTTAEGNKIFIPSAVVDFQYDYNYEDVEPHSLVSHPYKTSESYTLTANLNNVDGNFVKVITGFKDDGFPVEVNVPELNAKWINIARAHAGVDEEHRFDIKRTMEGYTLTWWIKK